MDEVIKLLIGVGILALGIPIGKILAKMTKEELKIGKKWFKLMILLGAILAVIFRNDAILFSLLFIAIVTSMSLRR